MKLTSLTLWKIPLTSHTPYYMSEGKTCDTIDSIVLRIGTDTEHVGWGEVCPIPHYIEAYADGVAPAVQYMSDELIGAELTGVDVIMNSLDDFLKGHLYAKSIVDIALWDLMGKQAQLPVYSLLGGKQVNDMPLYHSITCVAPDEMARMAKDAQDLGMTQFQVKLGADQNWQNDVERLVKVREAVGNGPLVYGDWNCGASQLEATRVGRAVAHLDIMLEQPCRTLTECAAVRSASGLPMKIDENAFDMASLLEAKKLGCLDATAVKLSKFGGLSASRRARDLCLHLGVQMCIEDVWGSDITTSALLHLGASTPPRSVMNVCDLSGYVAPRLDENTPVRKNGRIAPPSGMGLGVNPDLTVLGTPILEIG